ncbi:MAG: hypothetical protein HFJ09_10105 [Lachnospiraceae bacterium]|nr:hypothetical protein [Lachnospiraceae bacterium]
MVRKKCLASIKKAIVIVAAIASVLSVGREVLAASKTFSKKFVDSNQWTTVVSATKDSTSGFCSVTINDIYDANGKACNYKKVKAACYYSKNVAVNNSSYTVTKGKMCIMGYKGGFSVIGRTMTLKAMGNNPSLDCRISGAFNPD